MARSILILFALSFLVFACTGKAATRSSLQEGQRLYLVHCSSCHGTSADGKGPASASLAEPPRDIIKLREEGKLNKDSLVRSILDGLPGTGMPPYSDSITTEEAGWIAEYLLRMNRAENGAPD